MQRYICLDKNMLKRIFYNFLNLKSFFIFNIFNKTQTFSTEHEKIEKKKQTQSLFIHLKKYLKEISAFSFPAQRWFFFCFSIRFSAISETHFEVHQKKQQRKTKQISNFIRMKRKKEFHCRYSNDHCMRREEKISAKKKRTETTARRKKKKPKLPKKCNDRNRARATEYQLKE